MLSTHDPPAGSCIGCFPNVKWELSCIGCSAVAPDHAADVVEDDDADGGADDSHAEGAGDDSDGSGITVFVKRRRLSE